jgi:pyroglutamyl-peptidase
VTVRVLVTGFSVFPGAPANPSERLVELLDERRPDFGGGMSIETAVLPTAYGRVGEMLSVIGGSRHPDIALHFGLARTARGFRLESTARNVLSCAMPDVDGFVPPAGRICEGPDSHASTLPIAAILSELEVLGLPAELSENAGDYLCNYTFYSARAGRFSGFQPEICGFVHIPYLDHQLEQIPESEALPRLSEDQLWRGALAIIETCVAARPEAGLR